MTSRSEPITWTVTETHNARLGVVVDGVYLRDATEEDLESAGLVRCEVYEESLASQQAANEQIFELGSEIERLRAIEDKYNASQRVVVLKQPWQTVADAQTVTLYEGKAEDMPERLEWPDPIRDSGTDGEVYKRGRSEGRADVCAELRAILDPDDKNHWNKDGLLKCVAALKAGPDAATWQQILRLRTRPTGPYCAHCGGQHLGIECRMRAAQAERDLAVAHARELEAMADERDAATITRLVSRLAAVEAERYAVVERVCAAVTASEWSLGTPHTNTVKIGGVAVSVHANGSSIVDRIRDEIRKAAKG